MVLRSVALVMVAVSIGAVPAAADAPMSTGEATSVAEAIKLTGEDMPGYRDTPYVVPAGARRAEARTLRCAGILRPKPLVDLSADNFGLDATTAGVGPAGGTVTSGVIVMPTTAAALRRLHALDSKRGRACVAKYGQFSSPGVTTLSSKTSKLPVPATGVDAERTVMRVRVGRAAPQKLLLDTYAYRRGRVAVSLALTSTDVPFDAGEEQRLAQLVVTRVNQQVP
jgi:hypothetical protein